jgi:hypothetical protein
MANVPRPLFWVHEVTNRVWSSPFAQPGMPPILALLAAKFEVMGDPVADRRLVRLRTDTSRAGYAVGESRDALKLSTEIVRVSAVILGEADNM